MGTTKDAPATAWTWRAMGTTWRIYHRGGVDGELAREATGLVAADEERWTRFRPCGDVFHLNAGAGRPVEVAPETFALLELALRWQDETRGAFDPLVGAALAAWGYEHSLRLTDPGVAVSPVPRPLLDARVELDRGRGRARVPAGARLDLGGIAKGFSASRLAALLAERCRDRDLLIDAGGDLVAVRGEHVVGVEAPGPRAHDTVGPAIAHVRVREGQGIATSGSARRAWRNGDGAQASHLIDPRTGCPAADVQATVVAADPVTADVLATTLCVAPWLLAGRAEACAVRAAGAWRVTPGWAAVTA